MNVKVGGLAIRKKSLSPAEHPDDVTVNVPIGASLTAVVLVTPEAELEPTIPRLGVPHSNV